MRIAVPETGEKFDAELVEDAQGVLRVVEGRSVARYVLTVIIQAGWRIVDATPAEWALIEAHGYPELTPALKQKVFGLNGARVYGIDVPERRKKTETDPIGVEAAPPLMLTVPFGAVVSSRMRSFATVDQLPAASRHWT